MCETKIKGFQKNISDFAKYCTRIVNFRKSETFIFACKHQSKDLKTMKSINLMVCLLATAVTTSFAAVRGLDMRLQHYQPKKFEAAVRSLQTQYKSDFQPGTEWEKVLQELEANRSQLIEGIRKGDKKAIRQAENILHELDATLLANPLIRGKQVVAIRRTLGDKARTAVGGALGIVPDNFHNNFAIPHPAEGWKNEFVSFRIEPGHIERKTIYKPQEGMIIADPEPHFDGDRMMYSSIGTNNRWHLFELNLKDGTTHQLTPEAYRDFDSFEGCYAPDGSYIFCSTGTFLGLPCTDGGSNMSGLFRYDPSTGKTRQLTYDQDSNWGPVVMENGMILYQRWEYADLPHANSRVTFTMNPDGTNQRAYYGSNSYFPTS